MTIYVIIYMSLLYDFVRTTIRISLASCVADHSCFLLQPRERIQRTLLMQHHDYILDEVANILSLMNCDRETGLIGGQMR